MRSLLLRNVCYEADKYFFGQLATSDGQRAQSIELHQRGNLSLAKFFIVDQLSNMDIPLIVDQGSYHDFGYVSKTRA